MEKKIKEQEKEIKILKDVIENKFKNMEEHFEKKTHDLEKAIKQQQTKIENVTVDIQKLEIENEIIKCEKCEFTTNSEKGFKTHMKRKHPVNKETISCNCELCDYETSKKTPHKIPLILYWE